MTEYKRSAHRYALDKTVDDDAQASCEHDGDCLRAGCDQCVAHWRVPTSLACPLRMEKPPYASFCGCVDQRCRWFRQTPVLQTTSTVNDLAVQVSGKAVADGVVVARAAQLLEQQLDLVPCYLRFAELLPARHRFVVTTLGQYGSTDATVTGTAPRLRRCVDNAFAKLLFGPREISETLSNTSQVRISGLVKVERVWQ